MVPLEDFVPYSLAQLESILRVVQEPEDVRRLAVTKWLETNEPTPRLRWDLGEHGIGERTAPC
jgi:hypothetical protein